MKGPVSRPPRPGRRRAAAATRARKAAQRALRPVLAVADAELASVEVAAALNDALQRSRRLVRLWRQEGENLSETTVAEGRALARAAVRALSVALRVANEALEHPGVPPAPAPVLTPIPVSPTPDPAPRERRGTGPARPRRPARAP
jgi:hypothetical protein